MAKRRNVPTQYHPETDVDGRLMSENRDLSHQRWWPAAKEHLNQQVMARVRMLRNRQRARREMYRFYAEQYGTHEMFGLGLTNYDPGHVGFIAPSLPYNVVRRGVNTLLAKITKHKPLPMVLTSRGDYKQTKRALSLTYFLSGVYLMLKVFRWMRLAGRDALVFGTGLLRVFRRPGDILPRIRRVLPWECLVDVADARYGEPKQVFFVYWEDRSELKEQFPGFDVEIDNCSSSSGLIDDMPDYSSQADMVLVTEAYRLPTRARDGKVIPGRYAICIDSMVLEEGPYEKDHFDLVAIRYAEPLMGFWGDGLAAEMAGFQFEVNYATETLRMAHRVTGTGIWMVPDGADVPDGHFENGTGFLLKYKPGFKPEYESPAPANPQTYQYQLQCATGALEWSGISTMSANGTKPAGVTAAKALQTLDDIEADNQAVFEDAYEELSITLAERLIEQFGEIAAAYNTAIPPIQVPERRSVRSVQWKDVDMARDAIVMQVWPTNLLGRTPAARLQMVNDLFNGGIIDRALYLRLLDAPDVDAETDLATAMQEVADEQIQALLDLDATLSPAKLRAAYAKSRPDAYQDLVYAMHRAQAHICLGKLRGVPGPILDLLRRFIEDAKTELDRPTQEAAAKQAAAAEEAKLNAQRQAAGQPGNLAPAPIAGSEQAPARPAQVAAPAAPTAPTAAA